MSDPALAARLAALQTRVATSLVGTWCSAQGTFDVVMSERWEFRADGSATWSAAGEEEAYRWEAAGPSAIRLGQASDDGGIEWWPPIAYELAIVEHDAGAEIVLRQVGRAGFWLSDAPLRPV